MKVFVLQENLVRALSIVGRTVSSRGQLPILEYIYISAEKGEMVFRSTSLDRGISYPLGAEIELTGKTTVLAKTFSDFVFSLPPGKITLLQNKDKLEVSNEKTFASFPTLPASEFPPFPSFSKPKIEFPGEMLLEAISQTVFAASSDEGRPTLSGVKIFDKEGLCFVATDGFRLSLKKIASLKLGEKAIIVPAGTMAELSKLVSELKEETVGLSFVAEKNQIIFNIKETLLVSQLIEGEFPAFDKIVPTSFSTKAVFNKEEFSQAVRLASIFARDSANIVRLSLGKDQAEISANAPEVGTNKTTVEAKIEGEKGEIAFNFRFLLDFLKATSGEEIVFEMSGSLNPGIFRIKGDDSLFHLVMPVRVQEE